MSTFNHLFTKSLLIVSLSLFLNNCGGSSSSTESTTPIETTTTTTDTGTFVSTDTTSDAPSTTTDTTVPTTTTTPTTTTLSTSTPEEPVVAEDDFSRSSYNGLTFYYKNLPTTEYTLEPLTNDDFYALTKAQQLKVADKITGTLFFGYHYEDLQARIDKGDFIDALLNDLSQDQTDKGWLENYILDENYFQKYDGRDEPQAITILTRFYAMDKLDKYFFENYIAYILTQTIMFSPAYELDSSHSPNIQSVYNRIVTMLQIESGMRYMTYVHMMSEDNWRRFRSPEDNGREMMEIFLLDANDSHVPLAGKALQNWMLDTDNDTLSVSLNRNQEPLDLFGTTVYTGEDFYRELAKSDAFTYGVTKRLVDFFFLRDTEEQKEQIAHTIVASNPETWQDIFLQIIFSKEYLLNTTRVKSAEESFFSFAKKIYYNHQRGTFGNFKEHLDMMHQSSMMYKLGRLDRVPLDTLSFAEYNRYIRDYMLQKISSPDYIDNYNAWARQGWDYQYVDPSKIALNSEDDVESLDAFVTYLFRSTIARDPSEEELALFQGHMIQEKDGKHLFTDDFNIFRTQDDQEAQEIDQQRRRGYIALVVLDYISRLEETYTFKKVK